MKTDLQITKSLELLIAENLNDFLKDVDCEEELEEIDEKNVIQDFPDVDNSRKNTMFWIVPSYGENDELSVGSDFTTLQVSLFITSRRDKNCNLQKKVYGYFAALELLLWNHTNLHGEADFTDISSYDFYPAIDGDRNVAGIEVTIKIQYAKEYN